MMSLVPREGLEPERAPATIMMTRPQQLGLLIVLLVFIVYVCVRLR
jgi:hypothetical protein